MIKIYTGRYIVKLCIINYVLFCDYLTYTYFVVTENFRSNKNSKKQIAVINTFYVYKIQHLQIIIYTIMFVDRRLFRFG